MSFFAPRLDRITLSASNAATARVRELRAEGRSIIDLTIGQPDFETPPHVKQAVAAALARNETRSMRSKAARRRSGNAMNCGGARSVVLAARQAPRAICPSHG